MFQIPRNRLWLPLGVLLLGGSPLVARAEPTLGDLLVAAEARNPGAELAGAEQGIADALRRKAEQPFAAAPSVNLKYQTDVVGSDLGYREWEGGVELPLWLPGQAGSYAREAEGVAAASAALTAARRLELAGELRERLWAVATARSEASQAQSALQLAQGLRDDVQRRVAAGELPRSDSLLAQQELMQREEAAHRASNRALQAEQLFTRYTGMQPPAAPAAESPAARRELDDRHPQLQLAQRRVQQARAHRDRVARDGRRGPSVWLGGKSARAAAGADYESAIGVELSMPFGQGAHSAPATAEAEAALTTAQVALARTRLTLQETLTGAGLALDRLEEELAHTARSRDLAERMLALSRRAFELGETDLVRLLQAQGRALAARHDYQLRRLEHAQAVARLNQALGVIPQ